MRFLFECIEGEGLINLIFVSENKDKTRNLAVYIGNVTFCINLIYTIYI